MKRINFLFVIVILLSSCATISLYQALAPNRKNLDKLAIGMSQEEVLKVMGTTPITFSAMTINNPYRRTTLRGTNKTYEIIYYVTSVVVDDNIIDENELTPLVFSGGKLVGWGWGFVENLR